MIMQGKTVSKANFRLKMYNCQKQVWIPRSLKSLEIHTYKIIICYMSIGCDVLGLSRTVARNM